MTTTTRARIKQSPKRSAEERRRELLHAALCLFMKNGYRETSMDDIAHKAGLTKGAVYFHFSNKEEILTQLVKSLHESVLEKIRALPRRKANPVQVLDVLVEAQHGHGDAPFERFLDFWLQAAKIPAIRKFLGAGSSVGFYKVFDEVLDPRFAATPRDRRDLGVMILAAAEGFGVRKLMGDPQINMKRQMKLLSTMLGDIKNRNKRTH